MKDSKKRDKGKYTDVYPMIVNGVDTVITDNIVVGDDFDIIKFERAYSTAVPHICKDGTFVNTYSHKEETITETTIVENGKVIDFKKVHTALI